MVLVEIPLSQIEEAAWNSNEMNTTERRRLKRSIESFGLVVPIVVRAIGQDRYETIGGAQRLSVLQELGETIAECVVLDVDDSTARLISQALNHISGHENDGLRAAQMKAILESFSKHEVIELLPETAQSLQEAISFNKSDLGEHLRQWDARQDAKLKHRTIQFTADQADVFDRAVLIAKDQLADSAEDVRSPSVNPNETGNAVDLICRAFMEMNGTPIDARYRETQP